MKDETKKEKPLRQIKAIQLNTPGVKSCGKYVAGKEYKVGDDGLTNAEAHRLIEHKGFTEIK